jgi:hypothetical protein
MSTGLYIVTIRLPKNPNHDPRDKKSDICPSGSGICTDVTGEHHSYLMMGNDVATVRQAAEHRLPDGAHITRIEAAGLEKS